MFGNLFIRGRLQLDVREFLFKGISKKPFSFEIVADEEGIFVGSERLTSTAGKLGIQIVWVMPDGGCLNEGTVVFKGVGSPAQVAASEDILLGLIENRQAWLQQPTA